MSTRQIHVFISHAWSYSEHYDTLEKWIFQEQWNNLFNKHDTTHLVNESISLTATNLKSQLYNQALLIADIQIFRTLFYFGIVMMVFIMIYNPIKNVLHLRKKRKETH